MEKEEEEEWRKWRMQRRPFRFVNGVSDDGGRRWSPYSLRANPRKTEAASRTMRDGSLRLCSRSVKKMNLLQRLLNDVSAENLGSSTHRAAGKTKTKNEKNKTDALQLAVKRNSVQVAALYEDFNRCSVRTTSRRAKEERAKSTSSWEDVARRCFAVHACAVRHFFLAGREGYREEEDNAANDSTRPCRRIEHYRCKLSALDAMPVCFRQTWPFVFPCSNFAAHLLAESGVENVGGRRSVARCELQRVLRRLTFSKNDYLYDEATRKNKMLAVVAGSYPAKLAKAVRGHDDVDVFVVVTEASLPVLNSMWMLFGEIDEHGIVSEYRGASWSRDSIVAVKTCGRIQFVLKYFGEEPCLCDHHIDKVFFRDFHHATRWKLEVYNSFYLVRYIYADEKTVASCTAIDARHVNTHLIRSLTMTPVVGGEGGEVRSRIEYAISRNGEEKPGYPQKHLKNVLDWGPPCLREQALRAYLDAPCSVYGKIRFF